MNHRKINHLLNTELSAVETYEQALQEKEWKVLSPDPQIQALFHILVDHLQAVSQLGTELQRLGRTPVNGTQAWDSWSHRRVDGARLFGDVNRFGDKAALEVLKEGEESGLKEYQAVLEDHRALSPEVKPLIKSLKTKQQAHVRVLDNLMLRLGVSIRARSGDRPVGGARARGTRSGAPHAIPKRSKVRSACLSRPATSSRPAPR